MTDTFDAIVIGSGVSGGWAAKELTEKGLKVLMLDRGVMVEHGADYSRWGPPIKLLYPYTLFVNAGGISNAFGRTDVTFQHW